MLTLDKYEKIKLLMKVTGMSFHEAGDYLEYYQNQAEIIIKEKKDVQDLLQRNSEKT